MTGNIVDMQALPELLFRLLATEKVHVLEIGGGVQVMPIRQEENSLSSLVGMFAGDPNMSVKNFLERKRADKELNR
ncbi:MAG: hypothetical protein FWC91_10015 [Defluviitaleaceae bacterium]|nr:hypothetical protein [Defluviitaleaceae bacterium]